MDRSNREVHFFLNVYLVMYSKNDAEVFKGVVTDVILDETNPLVKEGIVGLVKLDIHLSQ